MKFLQRGTLNPNSGMLTYSRITNHQLPVSVSRAFYTPRCTDTKYSNFS